MRWRPKTESTLGLGLLRMRHLCGVPWLTPSRQTLLSVGVAAILVLSLLAVLKINGGGRQVPTKELLTGSIPRPAAVRKSASDERIVGCRLTNSSRPRDRTCEQFFSRYLSPAAVNFQNRE